VLSQQSLSHPDLQSLWHDQGLWMYQNKQLASRAYLLSRGRKQACIVHDTNPSRVRVDLPLHHPAGELILLDAYYPDWQARVDGRPERIELANSAFRKVPVHEGDRRVDFIYDPASYRLGRAISLITLALLAIWAIAMLPRGRRS